MNINKYQFIRQAILLSAKHYLIKLEIVQQHIINVIQAYDLRNIIMVDFTVSITVRKNLIQNEPAELKNGKGL